MLVRRKESNIVQRRLVRQRRGELLGLQGALELRLAQAQARQHRRQQEDRRVLHLLRQGLQPVHPRVPLLEPAQVLELLRPPAGLMPVPEVP